MSLSATWTRRLALSSLLLGGLALASCTPPSSGGGGGGTTTTTTTISGPTTTSTTTTTIPDTGPGPGPAVIVSGRQHSCYLRADGIVKCWGNNGFGQLGNGNNISSNTPQTVSGITDAIAIAAGAYHTCAITASGGSDNVKCWGNDAAGQLGDGSNTASNVPVAVFNLPAPATAIAAGSSHTCVIKNTGGASCWGDNYNGELGTGSNVSASTPRSVSGLNSATAIAAGDLHSCALVSSGTVKCWGANLAGQLGDGTNGDSNTPRTVSNLANATAVEAAGAFSCARRNGGVIVCWGENVYGELGNGAILPPPPQNGDPPPPDINSNIPVAVLNVNTAVSVGLGNDHACAVLANGTVKCWGRDDSGQLGDGLTTSRSTSAPVTSLTGATGIAGGDTHTCAARGANQVSCWGDNVSGQLGTGNNTPSPTPATVTGI